MKNTSGMLAYLSKIIPNKYCLLATAKQRLDRRTCIQKNSVLQTAFYTIIEFTEIITSSLVLENFSEKRQYSNVVIKSMS
jgi:hypothetical protein